MPETPAIRRGNAADLPTVHAIQGACPEAAQWDVADYLDYDFLVAIIGNSLTGFVVSRTLAGDERELLNLAVAPGFRRRGIARGLLDASLEGFHGSVFLEVRDSNRGAQAFYKSMNFQPVARREKYYESPSEAAIVMKFHSC